MAAAMLLGGSSVAYAASRRSCGSSMVLLAVCPARSATAVFMPRDCALRAGSSIVWKRRQCGGTILAARRAQYDDEEDWDEGPGLGVVPGIIGGALGAVGSITDFVMSNLPASVSRGVVDISVKAGLALVVLGFARSILSLAITVGTIVFGLWLASKVLAGDDGKSGFNFGNLGSQRRGSGGQGQRRQRRPKQRPPLSLPGSNVGDDLADVWFERRDDAPKERRQ